MCSQEPSSSSGKMSKRQVTKVTFDGSGSMIDDNICSLGSVASSSATTSMWRLSIELFAESTKAVLGP